MRELEKENSDLREGSKQLEVTVIEIFLIMGKYFFLDRDEGLSLKLLVVDPESNFL